MSITRISKTSDGNLMVDMVCWLSAHLTSPTSKFASYGLSFFPTYSPIVAIVTTSPTRMSGLPHVLRLPFSHTKIVTENSLAMKVRGSPYDWLTAPITLLNHLVCWLTSFIPALVIALKRAINSVKAEVTIKGLTASRAYLSDCVGFILKSRHTYIIPHIEIEEKYCAIATDRCRQTVMNLEC